jgi:hypothetical protein
MLYYSYWPATVVSSDKEWAMSEQKPRGVLPVDLKELKEPWVRYCKERSLVPGAEIRDMVAARLGASKEPVAAFDATRAGEAEAAVGITDKRKERVEIRLLGSEYDRVAEYAVDGGFENLPQWLVALVRAYLTKSPQFGASDRAVLADSNRQLLAMGRNLNQIAKVIQQQGEAGSEFTVDRIEQLHRWMNRHTELVSKFIAANVERWSVGNGGRN